MIAIEIKRNTYCNNGRNFAKAELLDGHKYLFNM